MNLDISNGIHRYINISMYPSISIYLSTYLFIYISIDLPLYTYIHMCMLYISKCVST